MIDDFPQKTMKNVESENITVDAVYAINQTIEVLLQSLFQTTDKEERHQILIIIENLCNYLGQICTVLMRGKVTIVNPQGPEK